MLSRILVVLAAALALTFCAASASAEVLSYECSVGSSQTKFLVSRETGRAIWIFPNEGTKGGVKGLKEGIHGPLGEARIEGNKTSLAFPYFAGPYVRIDIDRSTRRAIVSGDNTPGDCSEYVVSEFPRAKLKREEKTSEFACQEVEGNRNPLYIVFDSTNGEWSAFRSEWNDPSKSSSRGRVGRNDSYSIDFCIPSTTECTSREALLSRRFLQLNLITGDLIAWGPPFTVEATCPMVKSSGK